MPRALRSACLFAFVSALVVLSIPGCSQQAEGERCDSSNGDTDCNDGLSCIPRTKLLENITDRCCPAENTESDARCHRVGSSNIPTPSGGSSSTAGSANAGGGGAGGDASGGMSALPDTGGMGGAAGTTNAPEGGSSNSSAGMPAMTNGGADAAGAAGGGVGGAP